MSLNHLVTSTEVIDAIVNNLTVLGTLIAPTVTIGGFTPNMAMISDNTGTLTTGQIDLKTEVKNVLPIVSGGTNSNTALANGFLMQSLGGKIVESSVTPASVPTIPINLTSQVTGTLPVANGGTNSSTALTGNQLMFSDTGKIQEAGALTNGQLFIGNTGNAPSRATISVSANLAITNGTGTISLDTIQGIQTTSTPTFASLTLTNPLTIGNGGTNSSSALTNGKIMVSSGGTIVEGTSSTDPTFTTITGYSKNQTYYYAQLNTNQTMPTGSTTVIGVGGQWTSVASNGITQASGVLTLPVVGMYMITAQVKFSGIGIVASTPTSGLFLLTSQDASTIFHGIDVSSTAGGSIKINFVCSSIIYTSAINQTVSLNFNNVSGTSLAVLSATPSVTFIKASLITAI